MFYVCLMLRCALCKNCSCLMSSWVGSCISGSKLASVLLSESWYTFSNYVQNFLRFFEFCAKMSHPFGLWLRVSTKVFKSVNMSPNDKKDVLKNSGVQKNAPKTFLWNLNTYAKRMQHRHTFCLNRKFIFWKYHSQSLIHIKFLK